ncbi:MAG: hypothetical protein HZB34_03600 [Nitrospirae bacterium]|nr:hypothetical protein [Nitrospirota bacterium]
MNAELICIPVTPNLPVVLADAGLPVVEPTLQEWADMIMAASGEAVERIMAIGLVLLAARKSVKHGQWEKMFKGHPQAIDRPVPFSVTAAKMLMAVAAHAILANRNLCNDLPPSYRALYELSLLPHEVLTMLMAFGQITPETTVSQVKAWREFYTGTILNKDVKRRIRQAYSFAKEVNVLNDSQAQLYLFWGNVAGELRGETVNWTQKKGKRQPDPCVTHRCPDCGHEHVDWRSDVGNHE